MLLNLSAVPIGRERFQSAYPEASGAGKRGLGERGTWGKGDLESGNRKFFVVCSLWFIVCSLLLKVAEPISGNLREKRGLGERGTWGKGDLEIGSCLWFKVTEPISGNLRF
jgi:hypothetical protein